MSSDSPRPIPLWPENSPGIAPGDMPTLTPYLPPPDRASGAAVIICPGGGYVVLADHEDEPVCRWLNSLGVAAFSLHYRLAPRYRHPAMLDDAARAVRMVRARAAEWRIDPGRVGALGFSAGGHLVALLAVHGGPGDPDASDPIQRESARPDLTVLVYPAISMQGAEAHDWCRECLVGQSPTAAQVAEISPDTHVTPATPAAFLVHTAGDDVSCLHSLRYAAALKRADVPFELHLYERGGHGYGLAPDDPILSDWPARCAVWLRGRGFLDR